LRGCLIALRFLFAILLAIAALTTTCGDDDAEAPADSEEQETQSEEPGDARRQGGEITLASPDLPPRLDPHATSFLSFGQDLSLQQMLWRGLYSLDSENEVVAAPNGMAGGPPDVSGDGRVVKVRLNDGLTWSDGDDLRAEDFVAGIIRSCHPRIDNEFRYIISNIVGCEDFANADPTTANLETLQAAVGVRATDSLTIEFRLQQAQPSFPAALTLLPSFPVPVHLERFAAGTVDDPGEWGLDPDELVYNGPYTLLEFSAEERAALGANPNWSGQITPSLDRLIIQVYAEPGSALVAYRADEVQLLNLTRDPEQVEAAREEFPEELVEAVTAATLSLSPQLANEVLADIDVRLALAHAIDRESLNEALGGPYTPTTSWIPEDVSGVPQGSYDAAIGFDPEAARQHLAAAGYPGGRGFPSLGILVTGAEGFERFVATAEFLRAHIREVLGVDLEVEAVDLDTWEQRHSAGQFDLALDGWFQDYPDPENWILGLFDTGGQANFGGCSDPEIDALIEEARLNLEDQERRQQYRDVERLVIERVCGVIPYAHPTNRYLIKPDLRGFAENATVNDFFFAGDNVAEAWGLRAE
jgi:oligopeptide transport system substrate-binding protein